MTVLNTVNVNTNFDLLTLIKPKLDLLKPGDIVETKDLFDPERWESFDQTTKRLIGKEITYMADNGMIPLKVERTADGHKILTSDRHNLFRKLSSTPENEVDNDSPQETVKQDEEVNSEDYAEYEQLMANINEEKLNEK